MLFYFILILIFSMIITLLFYVYKCVCMLHFKIFVSECVVCRHCTTGASYRHRTICFSYFMVFSVVWIVLLMCGLPLCLTFVLLYLDLTPWKITSSYIKTMSLKRTHLFRISRNIHIKYCLVLNGSFTKYWFDLKKGQWVSTIVH